MRTRELAGQAIATVGIGDVSYERTSKRGRDPADTLRRVHEALEMSIDVIDVAPEEDTERVIAEAVRTLRMRDKAIVATRVPLLDALPSGAPTRDVLLEQLPVRYVVERIEKSLRATKLDAMPLVQLPLRTAWRGSSAWAELVGTCAQLVRDGKVLRFGARVLDVEIPDDDLVTPDDQPVAARAHPATALLEESWLASLAIEFSACRRDALPLIAAAAAKQVVVFALRPLAGGALAGTLGPGVGLSPRDDRRSITHDELEKISVAIAKLSSRVKIVPPAATSSDAAKQALATTPKAVNILVSTMAELALRYAIDRGTVALPRVFTRDALLELVMCGHAEPLPPQWLATIDEILDY